jgi:hypothetical protein
MKNRVTADDEQTACYVENASEIKQLGWLPFIDAIRTFLRQSDAELMFKLPPQD